MLSRLFEGLFEGGTYPALMSMSSHWVPEEEKATLSAFIWAGSQFGVVLAMPIAGLLAQVQSTSMWKLVSRARNLPLLKLAWE